LTAAAKAAPEADPQLLLTQPLVYGNAHTQVHSQVKHANGAVVPDDTLSVKAATVQHLAAKAAAYLNKPLVYTAPVVQTVAATHAVPQTVASPVVSYGAHPYVYGTHFIKREAEAEAKTEAEPEADPLTVVNPYYGGVVGVHHPVTYTNGLNYPVITKTVVPTTVVKPVVKSVVRTPFVYNYGLHTPLTTYNTHLIKREAEAEAKPKAKPEADPLTVINPYYGGVVGVHHPVTYTHSLNYPVVTKTVVPTTVVKPIVKSVVRTPFVYNYGLHTPLTTYNTHLIKREADAKSEADPALLVNPYTSVYGAGVYDAHTLLNPVTYTTPVVSTVAKTVVPTTVVKPVVSTVASPVVSYGAHPYVYGTHFIKREAEAEADPAFYYGNYGFGHPTYTTGYTGYTTGYTHGLNYAYNPVHGYNNYGYLY